MACEMHTVTASTEKQVNYLNKLIKRHGQARYDELVSARLGVVAEPDKLTIRVASLVIDDLVNNRVLEATPPPAQPVVDPDPIDDRPINYGYDGPGKRLSKKKMAKRQEWKDYHEKMLADRRRRHELKLQMVKGPIPARKEQQDERPGAVGRP